MKKIKYIGIWIIMLTYLVSCDLDTSPHLQLDGDNLTDNDIETLTLGTLAFLKENNGVMRSHHYFAEFGGDNISLSGTSNDPLMNIYDYNRITTSIRIGYIWSFGYKAIVNINNTLERINEGESAERDYVMGENLFLRAYHYWVMVTTFGQPYSNAPEQNLGVPLKLTSSMDDFPARSTVAEVYDQIVADLEKAVSLMTIPESSTMNQKDNAYPSKQAAEAFLSRIYLHMEKWDKAEEYATKVIESGRFELLKTSDFKVYPTFHPSNNKETIFAVRFNKNDKQYVGLEAWQVGNMYSKIDEKGYGEMYPSDPYLRLLDRFPNDARHAFIDKQVEDKGGYWFVYPNTANTGYITVPVEKQDDGEYTIIEAEKYGSPKVHTQKFKGGNQYYILDASGKKITGRVEEQCKKRNGYPMYYMIKLAQQEGEAQLWSPVILRLGEMYLNRAEARYQQNNISGALEDVNVIRKRAGIPTWTQSATAKEGEITIPSDYTIFDVIFDERRLELSFEAQRRMDIYRVRRDLDRAYPGGHITTGGKLILKYASPDIVEYIPEAEIKAYPNPDLITQNP